MAVSEMCRHCDKLYRGDGSCTDPDVSLAEQKLRATTGRCDSATKIYQVSGHTLKAVGSMVLNPKNKLWEFFR